MLAGTLATLTAASLAIIRPALLTEDERAVTQSMRESRWRADVRFLSSDLLEGRAPGTRGDELARGYVAARFEAIGLAPGAQGGAWEQPVELVGVRSQAPRELRLKRGKDDVTLKLSDDYIAWSNRGEKESRIDDAEIVFVGYGIVAPEYAWDDFKGADLRGKVLLFMNNDPERDPGLFAGKRRLYYGRWDYKYEIAAARGAAGAIVIHTTPSAGYSWSVVQNSWSGEQLSLAAATGPELAVKAWATEDACRRIAKLGGQDLDALRARAESRDFRPVPLGVTASLRLENEVSRRTSANVIGRLPGSDPQLAKEAVLFTAHHDHYGTRPGPNGTTEIYNGALDNAAGVASLLAVAEAFAALPERPAPLDPVRLGHGRGAGAARIAAPVAPPADPGGPRRGQHQHRRRQHLGPHARRVGDRPRQVVARRLGARARRDAGAQPSCPRRTPTRAAITARTT
jgi:hypothetical protein